MKGKKRFLALLLTLIFTLTPGLPLTAHAEAKNIGVGVTYAVDDTVVISNDGTWIRKDDSPTENEELDAGSYPVLEVTKNDPTYSQGKIQLQGVAFFGTYPIDIYVTKPEDKRADDPIGFRIKGGSGTEADPYTFEFVYDTAAPTTFTVYFNNGGGSGSKNPVTGVSGEYTLPNNPFAYPGYDFAGWQIGDDTTNVRQPGATINVTANVTLTARWTLKDLTFHIGSGTATFGTQSGTDLTVHMGDVINITAAAAPSGKVFQEWRYTDGDGSFGSRTEPTTTYTMGTNNANVWPYYVDEVETCIHYEGDVKYTLYAWSGDTPLPNTAGNYFLADDVALSSTWTVPAGVTRLCLHNHNITMNGTGPAISVPSGATLILYSDSATMDTDTNRITCAGGSGIVVNGGSLTTRGIKLYNNGSSGLVVNSGSAYITDWTYICDNGSASTNGGGIAVNGGSCTFDSGIISENTAALGGAVYVGGGTLSLAYSPAFSYNTATYGSDIYVANGTFNLAGGSALGGVYLAREKLITVTGTLSGSASITMEDVTGVFTSGLSGKGSAANFTSANPNYFVTTDAAGEAQIGDAHVHSWTYQLNSTNAGAAFVNASCTVGCDITSGLALGLYVPTSLTYNGSTKSATLSGSPKGSAYSTVAFPGTYTIYYVGINGTSYASTTTAPINPGDYRASVYVEGVTASVDFTITGTLPQHSHVWSYTASGAVLTATCADTDGQHEGENLVALTLVAPTRTVYGGAGEPEATITGSIPGVDNPVIRYAGRGGTAYAESSTAPTGAGDYTASITLGTATASVDYSISPATVTVGGITAVGKVYDGNTTAGLVTTGATFAGKLDGDNLTVTATGTFDDKNVGEGKTVTISGLTLGGASAGNYTLAASGQQASTDADITAKPVTVGGVTATNRDYEAGNLTVALSGGTLTGVLDVDTVTVDLTSATGTMADANAGENKAVTVAGAKLGGADAGNYTLSAQPTGVTVTISKAANPATVAGTASVTRDGKTVDLSANVAMNGATGAVSYAIGGEANGCTLSGSVLTSGENTGSVTVNVAVAADDNYLALAAAPITVTINDKMAQTISFADAALEKTWGDADFTVTATGAQTSVSYAITSGDAAAVDSATGAVHIVKAGTAIITATAAETSDYNSTTASCTLTVNPRSVAIPTAVTGLKWTGEAQTGVAEGDGYTVTDGAKTDVGNYTATATLTSTTNYKWSDGTTADKTIAWSIAKADGPAAPTGLAGVAPTTDGGNDGKITGVTTAMEYSANGTDYTACTGTEITGLGAGTYFVRTADTATHEAGTAATVNVPAYAVPTYEVTYRVVNGTWSDDSTEDKTESVASGSSPAGVPTGMKPSEGYTGGAWDTDPANATITEATTFTYTFTAKQAATVTQAPTAKNLTYNGQAQALVEAGSTSDGTLMYSINGKHYTDQVPTGTEAATYTVYYYVQGDDSHLDSVVAHFDVVIKPADSNPSSADELTYDSQSHALVKGGSASGGTLYYAIGNDDQTAPTDGWSEEIPEGTNAGTYFVWYKITGDANHNDVDPACIPVTIAKAPIQPTVTITGWTYGGQANAPSVDGNPDNGRETFAYSDQADGDYTDAVPVNANTWYVKATVEETDNYLGATTAPTSFAIARATVTITGLSAEGKTYDGTTTATVNGAASINGVVGSDDVSVVDGSACFDNANAGTGKTVTFTGWSLTGTDAGNYTLSAQPEGVTADITKKAVTVTAKAQTIEFGGSIATGTDQADLSGALSGHTLAAVTLTSNADPASVGIYEITPGAATIMAGETDVSANYEIAYEKGTLTVNKGTLDESALTADQKPAATNPTYTGDEQALVTAPSSLPDGYTKVQYSTDGGNTWSDDIPTATAIGAYTVDVKYLGDENHEDGRLATITSSISVKPSASGMMLATMRSAGPTSLRLTWTTASGVDGYDIFLRPCDGNSDYPLVASVAGSASDSYVVTGLKQRSAYKAFVRAWVMSGGGKQYVLNATPTVHCIAGGVSGKLTNAATLTLKKSAMTVKLGKTAKIKATVKGEKKGKKLLNHVGKLRYISSNPAVATVSAKGKVKAKGAGSCVIYVLTNNGIWKTVRVNVDTRPTKIKLKSGTKIVAVGGTLNLGARVKLTPANAITTLRWTSSKPDVASVDANGIVTAHRKGKITITVRTANGKKATVKVKVK